MIERSTTLFLLRFQYYIIHFRFGVTIPKDQNYAVFPSSGNDIKVEIKKLDKNNTFIAPWNYCDGNKNKWDHIDSFESLENASTPCEYFLRFEG